MFSLILKSILIIVIIETKPSFQLQCLDESGSSVDWFIVYKAPKLETSTIKSLKSGFGYTFITNKSIKTLKDWTLSTKLINEKESIFGQTIDSVISRIGKSKDDMSYVVYNDQSPESVSSSSAHSKGLFAIDSKGGFWLTHSVPKFPTLTKSYDFPESGRHNGQTALCISIDWKDTKSLNNIVYQLLIMRPKVYGIKIQSILSQKSKFWIDLKNKKWIKNDTNSQLSIKSKDGLEFTSFSKSNKYSKDMYSGLIATHFKENLLVQSWRNGAGDKLKSDCKDKYTVMNIDRIQLSKVDSKSDWNSTEDHSKWLITSESTGSSQTCISDINRMKSQFKRGGGAVCMGSDIVWQIFKQTVEAIEGCRVKNSDLSVFPMSSYKFTLLLASISMLSTFNS